MEGLLHRGEIPNRLSVVKASGPLKDGRGIQCHRASRSVRHFDRDCHMNISSSCFLRATGPCGSKRVQRSTRQLKLRNVAEGHGYHKYQLCPLSNAVEMSCA